MCYRHFSRPPIISRLVTLVIRFGLLQEKRAKVAPTIETDQPIASDEVAVPLENSVAIQNRLWLRIRDARQ